ncbi:MAG: hypothetical protein WBO23_06620 [Burkholderiales bacterium]
MKSAVVDPGFLIGLFDESDALHRRCRAFLREYPGRFLTTEAALAQTLALLSPAQQLRCLEWLGKAAQAGLLTVNPEPIDLRAVENLARKHPGRAVDLAEATLVLLAEQTGVGEILAADRRDYDAYGLGDRVRFIDLPEES